MSKKNIEHLEHDFPSSKKPRTTESSFNDTSLELKTENERLKEQVNELKKRESALVMRLSLKESELNELKLLHADHQKVRSLPSISQLHQLLLDPAVNMSFQKMKEDIDKSQSKLKTTQEELEAVQFTSNSITGKKLLAKCRLLQDENEEFGVQLSEERVHKLENEIALQRELTEELKKIIDGIKRICSSIRGNN